MATKRSSKPDNRPEEQDDKKRDGVKSDEARAEDEKCDPVDEASDESFPASDPPAWTATAATKNGRPR